MSEFIKQVTLLVSTGAPVQSTLMYHDGGWVWLKVRLSSTMSMSDLKIIREFCSYELSV